MIVKTPGTCSGEARVDGTRITVRTLASFFREGYTNLGIQRLYPDLRDDALQAARDYFAEHPEEREPQSEWDDDEDVPLPEDDAIAAAHPTRTGRHDLYAEALRLVGARHSKGGLVDLVNWLLADREAERAKLAAVGELLAARGCSCNCGHDSEGHDQDCARCFACRVAGAVGDPEGGGSGA